MTPKYSKEEFALRGDNIYKTKILPLVQKLDEGKFVAIDIETGDFEMDFRDLSAINKLSAKNSESQIWLTQVGTNYARRFGPRKKRISDKSDDLLPANRVAKKEIAKSNFFGMSSKSEKSVLEELNDLRKARYDDL